MEPHEHRPGIVVEHMKASHHFADVVPGDGVAVFPAIIPQAAGIVDLLVIIVQVHAGVHPALHHVEGRGFPLIPAGGENEDAVRQKAVLFVILPGNGCPGVVGVDLRETSLLQLQAQALQKPLVTVDIIAVEIGGARDAPHKPAVDILQGKRAGDGGFPVALNGEDGPLHSVVLGLQLAHLLVDLLVFFG